MKLRITDRGWIAIFIFAFVAALLQRALWEAHLLDIDGTRGGTKSTP